MKFFSRSQKSHSNSQIGRVNSVSGGTFLHSNQTAASSVKYSFSLRLTKRQKIIITTFLITFGLLSTATFNLFMSSYKFIIGLGFAAFLLSLWALWEGMNKTKAIVLMILPTFFTIAVASFYFLLPVRWLTRLPWAISFGLSFYILLLAQNVFNVASTRTIPLYRAASTVSFLFTLITAFFLFNVIFAFKMPFYGNLLSVTAVSFPLIMQMLWTLEMEAITSQIMAYSIILAIIIGECAIALSFWPVAPTIWSLTLSTFMYVVVGVVLEYMRDRLNNRVIFEYLGVGLLVVIFSFFTTSWVG